MSAGLAAMSARVPHIAITRPATPPAMPSTTDSVRSCRISRPRPAPSATRTASSVPSRRRTREQQVRDVRARDQQHEADGAEQHEQRRSHVAEHQVAQSDRVERQPAIRLRKPRLQLRAKPLQIVSDLLRRHAWLRAADDIEELGPPSGDARRVEGRIVADRRDQVGAIRQLCAGREDADNRVALAADEDAAAQHRWIAAELALPETVVEDGHAVARPGWFSSGANERPSADTDAEQRESVRR